MCAEKVFSYFSTKAYIVGTQKNGLNETLLLSTSKHMFYLNFINYSQVQSRDREKHKIFGSYQILSQSFPITPHALLRLAFFFFLLDKDYMNHLITKLSKWHVCLMNTQISLVYTPQMAYNPSFLHAYS